MTAFDEAGVVVTSDVQSEVRLATPGDVDELVELMDEFYAESGYALDRPWAKSSLLQLMARHGGLSAYVDNLFVRPALRRHGIGRALLDALFRECRARGCKAVQVEVGAGNTPALGLYATFGLLPHQDGRVLLSGAVVR